jgi:hypothetical protein
MYLRVYDSRVSSHQPTPSPSLHYFLTHAHSTLPTPTFLTITCTQVLWFIECLTWTTVSYWVTTSTSLTVCLPVQPSVCEIVLGPPVSAFSLSLYRHPFLYTLFNSRFTFIINHSNKVDGISIPGIGRTFSPMNSNFLPSQMAHDPDSWTVSHFLQLKWNMRSL